jgi:hypothetical protein
VEMESGEDSPLFAPESVIFEMFCRIVAAFKLKGGAKHRIIEAPEPQR